MRTFRNPPEAKGHGRRKKKASPSQYARARPGPNPAAVTLADVKPCLRTLLSAPDVSDPASREAEANVKRIADICGLYLTASFIHSYVQSQSPTNDGERKNHRPRGFELAGELYYQHLHAEVNSIEGNTENLGPRVFRSYCTELFDCFLAGEHVRKGVGYPIMLMEALLRKAARSPDNKSLYLALADEAMQSMEELSSRKFTKDTKDALRARRNEKKDNAPRTEMKGPHEIIDQDLFDHLQRLQEGYAVVRDGFEKTKPPRRASDRASEVKNHIAYLQELLNATVRGRCLGLTAMMKEILGRTLQRAHHENYRGYVLAAAQDLERLADEAQDLHLIVMSAHHYRKVHELYLFAGDRKKAEVAGGKLAKLKSDYDPQMLIISRL